MWLSIKITHGNIYFGKSTYMYYGTQNSKIVIWTTNKYFDQYYEHVSVHTKFGAIQVCARLDLGWPHPALVLPVYRLGWFIFSQTFLRELHITCIGSFHVSVHTSLGYESLCNLSIRSRATTTSTGAPCKHRLAVIFSLTHVSVYTKTRRKMKNNTYSYLSITQGWYNLTKIHFVTLQIIAPVISKYLAKSEYS